MANYTLEANQNFENISVDIKTTIFGVFQRVEVIAIADVVQKATNGKITYSDRYQELLVLRNPKQYKYLEVNTTVSLTREKFETTDYKLIGFDINKVVLFNFF